MSETAWDTAELKFHVLLKLILSGTPTLAVQRPSSQPGGPALGGLGRVNGPAPGFALAHLQHQDLEHVPVPRWPPADSPEEEPHRRGRAPFRVFPSLLTPVNFTGKSRFSHCWPPASALRRGPHLLPSWPPRPCAPSSAPSPGFRPRSLRPSRTTGDALRPPTLVRAARLRPAPRRPRGFWKPRVAPTAQTTVSALRTAPRWGGGAGSRARERAAEEKRQGCGARHHVV